MSYGGGNFVDYINNAGSGINETAIALFKADNAFETYHTFFDQLSVTNASVYDYQTGATIDYLEQIADQAAGRKVKMPIHVLYSYYNLVQASGFDVEAVWTNWTDPSANLTTGPICCGQGHFIIELAPDQAVDQLNSFLDALGAAQAP
jgi:hypothetical protein